MELGSLRITGWLVWRRSKFPFFFPLEWTNRCARKRNRAASSRWLEWKRSCCWVCSRWRKAYESCLDVVVWHWWCAFLSRSAAVLRNRYNKWTIERAFANIDQDNKGPNEWFRSNINHHHHSSSSVLSIFMFILVWKSKRGARRQDLRKRYWCWWVSSSASASNHFKKLLLSKAAVDIR